MQTEHRTRHKLMEWLRRYLPCEIAATVAELGGAALVYLWTDSFVLAAVIATVCSSVGYYGAAYFNAALVVSGSAAPRLAADVTNGFCVGR